MNNDLISREALKKAIEQGEGFSWDSHGKDDLCVRKKYIDNAPTVDLWKMLQEATENALKKAEVLYTRPQGEWIPIKTRELTEEEKEEYPDCTFMYDCPLPEDGEEVLVTTWSGDVSVDTFCRDDGCYFEYGCDEGDVIAWMPKPEPYKKGGAE